MITLRTNRYTKDDFYYVWEVLTDGIQPTCAYGCNNPASPNICSECNHRVACKDLTRLAEFVIDKCLG